MTVSHHTERHQRAAEEFNEFQHADNGVEIVESLSAGLNLVRELAFQRIHNDVEQYIGLDSMSVPLSLGDSEREAKAEIDIWHIVEAILYAKDHGYVDDLDWTRKWLGALRLGRAAERDSVVHCIDQYLECGDAEQRRLMFAQRLERVYPEASKAPLVLYQLWPCAVRIIVAIAFGHSDDADKLRKDQSFWLPGIMDCQQCHGAVLDNDQRCNHCDNPVWNYRWLTSAD